MESLSASARAVAFGRSGEKASHALFEWKRLHLQDGQPQGTERFLGFYARSLRCYDVRCSTSRAWDSGGLKDS